MKHYQRHSTSLLSLTLGLFLFSPIPVRAECRGFLGIASLAAQGVRNAFLCDRFLTRMVAPPYLRRFRGCRKTCAGLL